VDSSESCIICGNPLDNTQKKQIMIENNGDKTKPPFIFAKYHLACNNYNLSISMDVYFSLVKTLESPKFSYELDHTFINTYRILIKKGFLICRAKNFKSTNRRSIKNGNQIPYIYYYEKDEDIAEEIFYKKIESLRGN
jgi:hypothetical protein